MSYWNRAIQALRDAEAVLKQLIADALAAQEYRDVAAIAPLADGVAKLTSGGRPTTEPEPKMASADTVPSSARNVRPGNESRTRRTRERRVAKKRRATSQVKAVATGAAAGKSEDYPRFEREADRLVKLGWSERDQRVYEHRAPKNIIFKFADALASRKEQQAFTMDDVLPLKDDDGRELPSYQAYLAMAWLRHANVIQKVGKDGYSVRPGSVSAEALERMWEATPAR